jgi:hypothetical protein
LTLLTQHIFDKKFAAGPPPQLGPRVPHISPSFGEMWESTKADRVRRAFDAFDAFDAHSFYGETSSYRQLRAP